MKQFLLLCSFILCMGSTAFAQLPPGSTAPDWTETDLDGVSHTLYDYLDNNKVVFLDFSATWCAPCWNYHNSNAFKNLYNDYGPAGTDNVMAFMIEGDGATNIACLYGPSGCNNTTQGNWVAGTPYPIIDASNLPGPYAIAYYPTIYGVCPDKKIEEVGQVGASALWDFAVDCSAPSLSIITQTNVGCKGESTGAIMLNADGGIPPFTFEWDNGANTQDLNNIPAGNYTITVTGSLGGTKTLGPIMITEPFMELETNLVSSTNAGCGGLGGSAEVSGDGGTPGYNYLWSNGMNSPAIFGLSPGVYAVTTTDLNGCTDVLDNIVIEPPVDPTAVAAAPSPVDCNNASFFLDGSGSSVDPNLTYTWSTNDGHIISGVNTLNECLIDAGGTYELFIINNVTTCTASTTVTVSEDLDEPTASASSPENLDCTNSVATLSGIGSSAGTDFEYLWSTTNGNIVSGATTLAPEADKAGTYIILVTNTSNGCTSEAETELSADTEAPNASATGGEITCVTSLVELQGNSTTSNVTYDWVGPNNFTSTEQDPEVDETGTYTLTVTSNDNGCTETATADVEANTAAPEAIADGGTITCVEIAVTLDGNSSTSGATFAWTGPNNFTSTEQNPEVDETGTYTLTVTGPNGCTESDNAVVNENTAVPTAEAGNAGVLNCNSSEVVLNGTGSSNGGQFTYLWTTTNGNIVSGETTLTPTVDAAGDYSLLVTNSNNGCESDDATTITATPPVVASISAQTNVDCFGNENGAAMAGASGGSGNFEFEWSNGETTQSIDDVAAGTYTVTVTDDENCTATETVTISQPNELLLTATTTAQTEPGVNDGTATASASGGTGNYTYLWNNGETTATINGLAPGTYTVEVTDENGCTETQTVTVNEFGCAITATLTGEDVSCNGANDGAAAIELDNASAPYTYLWSNGETTESISDLEPGSYGVTATDDNGCEIVSSVEVEQPAVLKANTTATAVTSAGAEDGTASASPTGGTGPFTYEWSNGETTATITDLPSANYTVIVTDVNGCTDEQTVPVPPFECIIEAEITSSNISCNGENNGQATVTLEFGLSPYTYEWSNGETTATINDLAPGTYSVEVVDAVNCPVITEVTIAEPAILEAEISAFSNADCGESNGSATVEAQGGTSGYSYEWSTGETTASIENLSGGTYSVIVTDANDCAAETEIVITVNDTEAPSVSTQDISISLDSTGSAEITPAEVDNGSSDNCAIASMALDISSFDCEALGEQEVTLTVTDEAGNSSSSTAIVTVVDDVAPSIAVQSITLNLDENGEAVLDPGMIDNGSSDNCGITEMSVDLANFTCADIGANAVVLTIKDAAGNASSGTATVTVEDNLAPMAECPENMVLSYCDPVGEYTVTAEDNCSDNLSYGYPADYPSGANFPTGVTEMEVTVTDEHDNTTTCSFTVTVPEEMKMEAAEVDVTCFGEGDGSIETNVTGGTPGYTYLWSNGETTSSIENLSAGIYSVVVTDDEGCTTEESYTVDEPTQLVANVINIINETNNNQDGSIDISATGGTGSYTYKWTDENGNFISNEEDISDLSAGTYNVEVTDENGCVSVHSFTVQMVVSIIDHEMATKIKLFPNPTTGLVTLEMEDIHASAADVYVFDVNGKMAISNSHADITSGIYQFDMSEHASGIYIVRILIENSVVTKRLMVSK